MKANEKQKLHLLCNKGGITDHGEGKDCLKMVLGGKLLIKSILILNSQTEISSELKELTFKIQNYTGTYG